MVSNPNVPTSTASTALQASILSSPRTFKRPCANSARCKAPLLSASRASKRLARSLGRSKSSISLWTCRSCTQASSMISWQFVCQCLTFRRSGVAILPYPAWMTSRKSSLLIWIWSDCLSSSSPDSCLLSYSSYPKPSKSGPVIGDIWGWSSQIGGKQFESTNLTLLFLLLASSMTEIVGGWCHPATGSN